MRKFLLILVIIFWCLVSKAQTPLHLLRKATAAVNNAYPTFVSATQTAWDNNTSPKTTASISVNNGDIIVAFASNGDNSVGDLSISGGGLTWTQRQAVSASGYPEIWGWTTTATSTTSFQVTITLTGTSGYFGAIVYVYRDSNGYDNSSKSNAASSAPSLSLTPSANNCTIISHFVDWNAGTGSRTWRSINSITPSAGNGYETTYQPITSEYTVYGGYWYDAGTSGAKTTGLSAPSMKWSGVSISISGN